MTKVETNALPSCAVTLEPEGWILRTMAEVVLRDATRITPVAVNCTEPVPGTVDCVYYPSWPHYYQQPKASRRHPLVAMTTHIDRFAFRVARMVIGKQARLLYMADRYRRLLRWYGISSRKLMPGRLGVDIDMYDVDRKTTSTGKKIRIGTVSRIYPDGRKGEDMLMDIVHQLDPSQVELCIVGDLWDQWIQTAEKLGLHIDYHPRVDASKLPGLYQSMDALIIPSHCEGGPVTALEALASGTPLISRDVGYVDELIRDFPAAGVLFSTPDQGSAAISQAREMKRNLSGLREKTREAIEPYSWASYVKYVEDGVLDVLA